MGTIKEFGGIVEQEVRSIGLPLKVLLAQSRPDNLRAPGRYNDQRFQSVPGLCRIETLHASRC